MTAANVLDQLRASGITVTAVGDRLRLSAKPGALTAAMRADVLAVKGELIHLLQHDLRDHLHRIAADAGLPESIVETLDDDDLAETVGCYGRDDVAFLQYLRLLAERAQVAAGQRPAGFTKAATCSGCGRVWLWPSAPPEVIACPWCFRRKAGMPIPRPVDEDADGRRQG
jgi:hypothetical protein